LQLVSEVPVLLTVEEAGELLRIGRTKAYALTREWRETNGRSGLPVIDLGNVLRVPRHALEEMIGGAFSSTDLIDSNRSTVQATPTSRAKKSNSSQPDLFNGQPDT
jgi:hypothetical protein